MLIGSSNHGSILSNPQEWGAYYIKNPTRAMAFAQGALVGRCKQILQVEQAISRSGIAIQETASMADLPASVKTQLEAVQLMPNDDEAFIPWFFEVTDYSGTLTPGFDVRDVEHGVTFEEAKDGKDIEIHSISGSRNPVSWVDFGGAVEYKKSLLEDGDWASFNDLMMGIVHAERRKRVLYYYLLIEAAGTANGTAPVQDPDPANLSDADREYNVSRWLRTINYGQETMLAALDTADYPVGDTQQFGLVVPSVHKNLTRRALSQNISPLSFRGNEAVTNDVVPFYTRRLSVDTYAYLGVPKIKNKAGNKLALETLMDQNILRRSELVAGWSRSAAFANTIQWYRLTIPT